MYPLPAVLAACFLLLSPPLALSADYVWWEAESPARGTFPASTWLSAKNDRERAALSGGAWLTGAGEAEYVLEVRQAGRHELWARTFGPRLWRWRLDDGPWQQAPLSARPVDAEVLDIRDDRYFTASWVKVAEVDLAAGSRRFTLEATSSEKPMAWDCFLLTREPFTPNGRCKPGEKLGGAPEGWWPFEPDPDPLAECPLDLSGLNEKEAGSKGPIVRKDGRLVFERTGEPIRFWGVTACSDIWLMEKTAMDYLARRLAKMGVNAVRLHVAPYYELDRGPQTDGVHYLAAALKRNGIYTGYNWYCSACNKADASWGLPELKAGEFPWQAHLFYEPMQTLYKKWARNLLGTTNPYTGLTPLADPATLFVELVDEDNLFFFTFRPQTMPEKVRAELERRFAAYCAGRGTDPFPLYPAADLGGQDWAVAKRDPAKAALQTRFMVELQKEFYAGMREWLNREFGYRGLLIGSNWKATDERVLGPLDKYSEFVTDITARNTYFAGGNTKSKFFPWMVGMEFQDASLLLSPVQALTMHVQYEDYPHFITEGGYAMPNRFRTEEQLLMASYSALQDVDGLFPFQIDGNWLKAMRKWPIQTPATFGQYPAAALIYRRGLVAEGPVVVREALKPDELFALRGAAASTPLGLDDVQAANAPKDAALESASGSIDPMTFYAGRVVRHIADSPGETRVAPIDHKDKVVRSATGELALDYGRGLLKVDAPQAQGATGFLARAGRIDLGVLTVESANEYGAVTLVALDGKPLAQSARMLLQVMTEEQNNGWKIEGGKLADVGGRPLIVRNIAGAVSLRRPDADALRSTALDVNGYPAAAPVAGGRIALQPRTLYYLIEK